MWGTGTWSRTSSGNKPNPREHELQATSNDDSSWVIVSVMLLLMMMILVAVLLRLLVPQNGIPLFEGHDRKERTIPTIGPARNPYPSTKMRVAKAPDSHIQKCVVPVDSGWECAQRKMWQHDHDPDGDVAFCGGGCDDARSRPGLSWS